MEWLNYHHLFYFWTVVRTGTIARATEELLLAQPTISAQLRQLEKALGQKLLARSGRSLVPTDVGRVVYRYADEIFSVGREMMDAIRDRPVGRPLRLQVGVADAVPKQVAYELLKPALHLAGGVHLICRENKPDKLLAELALHELDLVVTDAPIGLSGTRTFNHLLGECGISFLGAPAIAARYRKAFPRSLERAPMLLPTTNTSLRRALDQWFSAADLHPRIVAEFEDAALLRAFGEKGIGVCPVPSVIERELCRHHGLRRVGRTTEVRERFYAISAERRITHPAVAAISGAARRELFA